MCGNKLKPYECTVPNCGQKYRSKSWLSNHMVTKHPETDKDVVQHICCKCGTDLTSKQALKAHEKSCNALTPDDLSVIFRSLDTMYTNDFESASSGMQPI